MAPCYIVDFRKVQPEDKKCPVKKIRYELVYIDTWHEGPYQSRIFLLDDHTIFFIGQNNFPLCQDGEGHGWWVESREAYSMDPAWRQAVITINFHCLGKAGMDEYGGKTMTFDVVRDDIYVIHKSGQLEVLRGLKFICTSSCQSDRYVGRVSMISLDSVLGPPPPPDRLPGPEPAWVIVPPPPPPAEEADVPPSWPADRWTHVPTGHTEEIEVVVPFIRDANLEMFNSQFVSVDQP